MSLLFSVPREPDSLRRRVGAWLETLLIVSIFLLAGFWIDQNDPFFLRAEFPWLILAPLLPALRYGFHHGFLAALVLVALMALAWHSGLFTGPRFPAELAVGMLIVGMLSGEFADSYMRRLNQQRVINDYQRLRLDEFTRNYHLLKVSHDRLEHRLAASSHSLRGALLELRKHLSPGSGNDLASQAQRIMSLFTAYGWVQVAALYAVRNRRMVVRPLAMTGQIGAVDPFDPLVRRALVEGRMTTLTQERLNDEDAAEQGLLAVVPLVDVSGHVWAIVCIREMPFIALQEENLRLFAVLGGHIGDILAAAQQQTGPDPELSAFMTDLRRALTDHRLYGLPALVVVITLPADHPDAAEMARLFVSQSRGLDRIWQPDDEPHRLFLLMPLTHPEELVPYRNRMDRALAERFGHGMDELGIHISSHVLQRRDDPDKLLETLRETVAIPGHTDPDLRRPGA